METILLVEDDERVASFIESGLKEKGYTVHSAKDGKSALDCAGEKEYDCIILDILLPDMDGFQICAMLRMKKVRSSVIMLSALGSPEERVRGLESGADDYLTKPFHFRELLARIIAQSRRKDFERGVFNHQKYADLEIDPDRHEVKRNGKLISLSPREFKLLGFLMKNREKVLSRTEITEAVWDIHFSSNTNVVDVYMNYLRNKIDKGYCSKLIHTIKGRGYILKTDVS